jgi:hypothetical protein
VGREGEKGGGGVEKRESSPAGDGMGKEEDSGCPSEDTRGRGELGKSPVKMRGERG